MALIEKFRGRFVLFGILILLLSIVLVVYVDINKAWVVDTFIYAFFTVSFFSLLGVSFLVRISEFLIIFNSFLFLGFWGKTTVHIIGGHDFIEAFGRFGLAELQRAMIFASVSSWVLFVVQLFLKKIPIKSKAAITSYEFPPWMQMGFLLLACLLAYLNWQLGFLRVGLAPLVKLPFPLGPGLSWFMGPGCALLVFTITSRRFNFLSTMIVGGSMAFISISTLSRNSLIYYAYPAFIKFLHNLKDYKKGLLYSGLLFLIFIFSIIKVSHFRIDAMKKNSQPESFSDLSRTKTQMKELFIDRWVGIEGTIVSEGHQSDENFKRLLLEDAKKNPNTIYRTLSKSDYPMAGEYLFYTLPGPLAIINFAKSWHYKAICFAGYLLLLGITYLIIELSFEGLSKSAMSWWAAANLAQVSLFPIYNLKVFFSFLVFSAILFYGVEYLKFRLSKRIIYI